MNVSLIAAALALAAMTIMNAERAGRAESALRRIVETQAAAMAANHFATQEEYEKAANERDDAIDDAESLLKGEQ